MRKRSVVLALIAAFSLSAQSALADDKKPQQSKPDKEVLVFVTGSLIPQRVKLHPIATNSTSPVRIIDRAEIDQTGRRTTGGALINEPAVRVIAVGR